MFSGSFLSYCSPEVQDIFKVCWVDETYLYCRLLRTTHTAWEWAVTSLLWELSGGTNFDLVRNKTVLFCQCLSLSLPAVSLLGNIRGSQDCLIPITMEAEIPLILGLSLATGLLICLGSFGTVLYLCLPFPHVHSSIVNGEFPFADL